MDRQLTEQSMGKKKRGWFGGARSDRNSTVEKEE